MTRSEFNTLYALRPEDTDHFISGRALQRVNDYAYHRLSTLTPNADLMPLVTLHMTMFINDLTGATI